MRFIETHRFTVAVTEYLSEESYRLLQLTLASRPDLGKTIPGSGGLRKLRWRAGQRGKRGGTRVIYYWKADIDLCYLLSIYSKRRNETLTVRQLRALRKLVAEEFE